ncbi:LOW QUALITY PROTEIN: uncharacterized protein RBU47_010027 [Passerculus sandwichensis]
MSRKKSGFAITSVRGGSGSAAGDASGAAAGSAPSSSGSPSGSRFRLVRLLSPGEVLRRGRWLCRDFYERDASPRGGGGGGVGGGRVPVSLDAPRAVPAPHQPRSLGAFAQLVQQALPPKPPSPRPGGGAELSARLGLAGEESEDEGAGSGVTAIDNKIERAMDLVKSHLLLAVREEVEALREQIRELSERRAALERENRLLRALATPQQLARLPPGPPEGAWPPAEAGRGSAAMRPRALPPPPPGGILRRGGRGGGHRQVRFAPVPAEEDEEDDEEEEEDEAAEAPLLATPTPHSTRAGPGGAAPVPFDAPRAAAALLGSSWAARSALGGAAAAAMNVPPAQRLFRGLVSLAVPPPPPGPRRGVPPAPPPQVPGPCLAVLAGGVANTGGAGPCLPPPAPPEPPRARPRPPGAAFAMYRKRLQWGGG